MKVFAFNGSPRKKGNTETLLSEVLMGAAGKGAETRLICLNELNMKGCQGCGACRKKLGACVQKDDVSPLLQEMKNADALVFGTPVYCYNVSSQFKALIDRFYCFYGEDVDPVTGEKGVRVWFPSGKKIVIVTSQEAPDVFETVHNWLSLLGYLLNAGGMEFIEHCASENKRNSARDNPAILSQARAVGEALVKSSS